MPLSVVYNWLSFSSLIFMEKAASGLPRSYSPSPQACLTIAEASHPWCRSHRPWSYTVHNSYRVSYPGVRKRPPLGAPSVRKVPQLLYIWLLFGLCCHNPMLAIPMDSVTYASYYLFIASLYQVGTGFVILSYQLSTSFAWFTITWISLWPKGIAQGTEDKVLLLI